jgi:sugar lactone lactonase YvrE
MRRVRELVGGLRFAEGLRWHGDALWFSDMLDKRVYRCSMAGDLDVVLDGIDQPSGLGFTSDDEVVVVERGTGSLLVAGADGVPSLYADLAAIGTVRPNDMVTASDGWRYVGSLGHEYELGEERLGLDGNFNGTLVGISPEREATVVASGLGCANAMVFTDEGRTLVLAETYGARLLAYDRHDDGSLSNRRTLTSFGSLQPDGMALDAEGCAWVALSEYFGRVDLSSGAVVDRIALPELTSIACALGGTDGRTLFMAGAKVSMDDFLAGRGVSRIMVTEVEVPSHGGAWH